MHDADTIRGWLAGLPTPSEEIMGDNYGDRNKWNRLRRKQMESLNRDGFGKKGSRRGERTAKAQGRPTGLSQAQIDYIRNL